MSEAMQYAAPSTAGVGTLSAPAIQKDVWIICRTRAASLLLTRGLLLPWLFGMTFGIAYAVTTEDTAGWIFAGVLAALALLVVGAGYLKFWVMLYPLVFLSPQLSLGKFTEGDSKLGIQLYEPWILFLLCLWIPQLLVAKRLGLPRNMKRVLGVLLGIGLLGILISPNLPFGIKIGIRTYFEPLLLFAVITSLPWSRSELRSIACVFLCVATVAAGLSILGFETGGDSSTDDLARLQSCWEGANVMAVFVGTAVVLSLGWMLSASSKIKLVVGLAASLAASVALVLTYSRGTWLAVGTTIAFMTAQLRAWLWGFLAALSVVLGLLLGPPQVLQRVLTIINFTEERSSANRLILWPKVVDIIADQPLTGYGFSGFFTLFRYDPDIHSYHPHNIFLEFAVALGIPALLLFFGFVGYVLLRALKVFLQHRRAEDAPLLLGLCAASMVIPAAGLTDGSILVWTILAHIFWFLLALTYAFTVTLERDLYRPQ